MVEGNGTQMDRYTELLIGAIQRSAEAIEKLGEIQKMPGIGQEDVCDLNDVSDEDGAEEDDGVNKVGRLGERLAAEREREERKRRGKADMTMFPKTRDGRVNNKKKWLGARIR